MNEVILRLLDAIIDLTLLRMQSIDKGTHATRLTQFVNNAIENLLTMCLIFIEDS